MGNYDHKEEINGFVGKLENGPYVFLDYLFESGNLKGATGTKIYPVSREYVNERIEEIKDYEYSPLAHIYDEQNTKQGWEEWIEQLSRRELEGLAVDPSGGEYWDKMEELCDKYEDFEFYTTDCIGGGRIFSNSRTSDRDNYEILENPELLEKAKKAEKGEYF